MGQKAPCPSSSRACGGDGVGVAFESAGFGVKLTATRGQRLDGHGHGIGWGGERFGVG